MCISGVKTEEKNNHEASEDIPDEAALQRKLS
jgi:hypothetical protein